MALTVVQYETILIGRAGQLMTAVGLDGTTKDGDNPDLVDPMSYGIRNTDGSVADITDITDADLASFAESDYDQLFDIAELRVYRNCYSAATTKVDTDIGPRNEKFSGIANSLKTLINDKQKDVDKQYELTLPTMSIGIINLNTQERGDDPEMTY